MKLSFIFLAAVIFSRIFSFASALSDTIVINYFFEKDIIKNTDEENLNLPINRAEALKIIYDAGGIYTGQATRQIFADVPKESWFASYANYSAWKGVTSWEGHQDTFQPGEYIDRGTFFKMLFDIFGVQLEDYEIHIEAADIAPQEWYSPYLSFALQYKIISADDNDMVYPARFVTKKEALRWIFETLYKGKGISESVIMELIAQNIQKIELFLSNNNLIGINESLHSISFYVKYFSFIDSLYVAGEDSLSDLISAIDTSIQWLEDGDMVKAQDYAKQIWKVAHKLEKKNDPALKKIILHSYKLSRELGVFLRSL